MRQPRTDGVPDGQLVQHALRRPEDFRDLYRRYFPRVYAYVAVRVGSREDAEDITATVMLRTVERLHTFHDRGPHAFAAWLFRIAHNAVVDFFRVCARTPQALPIDALPEVRDDQASPDDTLLRSEDSARLRRLVAALSPRRQEVVTLRFFAQLRNREISEILGIDERAVASHMCRALEELHHRYSAENNTRQEVSNVRAEWAG